MKIIEKLGQSINLPISNSYTGMVITGYDLRIVDIIKRDPNPKKNEPGGFYLNSFVDVPVSVPGESFHPDNAKLINTIIRKNNLWGRTVSVLGADKSLIVKRVEAPAMEHDELLETLRLTEREGLSYPMETAALDAMILGPSVSEGQIKVMMAALDGEVASKYNAFVRRTNFKHIAISIVPSALSALIENSLIIDKEAAVPVISIGKNTTGIYVFQGGDLKFTRDVYVGGDAFTKELMGEYEVDGEIVEVNEEEAEQMKILFGVPRGADLFEAGVHGITGEMFLERMRPALERMVTELGRSLDYFKNEYQVRDIPEAYLIGLAASLANLPEYITENLGYRFSAYNPFEDFIHIEDEALENARTFGPGYAVSVGIALDQGSRINLLPVRSRYSIKGLVKKIAPIAAVILYSIIVTAVSIAGVSYRKKLEANISSTQQKISGLKVEQTLGSLVEVQTVNLKNEITAIETRMTVYPELQGRSIDWGLLFSETGMLMPFDIALNKVNIRFDRTQEIATDGELYSKQVILDGRIRGKPNDQIGTLQQFLRKVEETKYFLHPTLLYTKQSSMASEGESLLLFSLSADIQKGAK